jgi:hypothetical protein
MVSLRSLQLGGDVDTSMSKTFYKTDLSYECNDSTPDAVVVIDADVSEDAIERMMVEMNGEHFATLFLRDAITCPVANLLAGS